jgi:predicted short-subunit dehydrogenase-like oxidoreductase (DUF2520 family)
MLPGMAAKPRIAIVGPGNLGSALAESLRDAGFVIDAVIARPGRKSLSKARKLAKEVGARVATDLSEAKVNLIWLCVPDSEIKHAAQNLAGQLQWKGRVALHSSGALTSDELEPLRRGGAAVASVHPLMTFVRGSRPSLARVPFAIEGGPVAVRAARNVVRALGGLSYSIRKKDKAAYHAWGMFASPLLTALFATSEQVAALAGVKGNAARRRVIPILLQTLANYAAFRAPGAFSGPIIRGDVDTVRRNLRALGRVPVAREVYSTLAKAAMQYLPARNKNSLQRVLETSRN